MNRHSEITVNDTARQRFLHAFVDRISTVFERTARRLFALCLGAVSLILLASAQAQPIQLAPDVPKDLSDIRALVVPPLPLGAPKAAPAPDWMIWRWFYRSLDHYERGSPTAVHGLLLNRVGLEAAEASVARSEGSAYLKELTHIDDQARAEIRSRFSSDVPLLTSRFLDRGMTLPHESTFAPGDRPLVGLRRSLVRFGFARSDLIPARTPDGRPIKEVLAAEGFIARFEARRNSAFRAHWESLAESIGLFKLVALERFIEQEVAPNVHVATRARRVPAPYPIPKDRLAPR